MSNETPETYSRPGIHSDLYNDVMRRLPAAATAIAMTYYDECLEYGLDPGVVRVFAVGSLIKRDGANFNPDSDVDIVFSVERPQSSLAAFPTDSVSLSEADDIREQRHRKLLEKFNLIWKDHGIVTPLNVPHGETIPEIWGLEFMSENDFSTEEPGRLVAEFDVSA